MKQLVSIYGYCWVRRLNAVSTGIPINGTKIAPTIISKMPLKPAIEIINQFAKPESGIPVNDVFITLNPIQVRLKTNAVLMKADSAPRPTNQAYCCAIGRSFTKRQ